MQQLIEKVAELSARIEKLEASQVRDRGPKSTKEMTEAIAFAVHYGEDKDLKPKIAAEKHGVSYGQIFSARGGYTFKQVTKDWKPKAVEVATA
jgi:hypothetical protein